MYGTWCSVNYKPGKLQPTNGRYRRGNEYGISVTRTNKGVADTHSHSGKGRWMMRISCLEHAFLYHTKLSVMIVTIHLCELLECLQCRRECRLRTVDTVNQSTLYLTEVQYPITTPPCTPYKSRHQSNEPKHHDVHYTIHEGFA